MASTGDDAKADLHRYLRSVREAVLWKLDGLSEYDVRRPMTPTATNLLGLVKHLATIEWGYLCLTFDRPLDDVPDWFHDETTPNVDMWATADQSREEVVALYRRVCAAADRTIEELALDDTGRVPWWSDGSVSLHWILVHVLAETNRHAGQMDVVRELLDGAVGLRADNDNMADGDASWWTGYRERVEQAARTAAGL
ncbi:DinB family protein [Actinotalea sp. Marseille-Q4924]|uniref:DinB family protein n=1 Tax=Actinotalea sp. Marseille-Q4924 TaxID=2866571 RepID=UPI001CE4AE1B|nr:DinB family protein [Actinotalea sp. Marseille-Q4924]